MNLRDKHGRPITKGARVRTDAGEGVVNHLEPEYGVLTIVIDERASKRERMVRAASVEVVDGSER